MYAPIRIRPADRELSLTEQVWWHPLTNRREMVRSVAWCTILGRSVRARLRPGDTLVDEFVAWRIPDAIGYMERAYQQRAAELPNGCLALVLSEDVIQSASKNTRGSLMCNREGRVEELAVWLHCQLRKRGMLA